MNYLDLLMYLASHPIQAFFIVLAQFIVIMKIHHKYHNPWIHYPMALWFIPQDVVLNLVFVSILGLEFPKFPNEWLTTTRLKRWKKIIPNKPLDKWRLILGWWFCNLLNKYDVGHC